MRRPKKSYQIFNPAYESFVLADIFHADTKLTANL